MDLKLNDMGVNSEMVMEDIGIDDRGELRIATREYCIEILQGYLLTPEDEDLTICLDSLGTEVWAFVAGYEACLEKQLALQPE